MGFQRFRMSLLWTLVFFSALVFAQDKSEVSVVIGRPFLTDQPVPNTSFFDNTIHFGHPVSVEASYGRKLLGSGGLLELSAEVPLLFSPNLKLNYGINTIPKSYTAFFVAPSVKLNVFAANRLSPWVSFGGGIAHFSESDTLVFGGPNPGTTGTTTGVYQIGGGLDIKLLESLSIRSEVRDYNSGIPQLNVDYGKSRQRNLFVGGGIVFHF